jgi:hypothetical protein
MTSHCLSRSLRDVRFVFSAPQRHYPVDVRCLPIECNTMILGACVSSQYMYVYIFTYIHIYVCMYIYIYIYIYIYDIGCGDDMNLPDERTFKRLRTYSSSVSCSTAKHRVIYKQKCVYLCMYVLRKYYDSYPSAAQQHTVSSTSRSVYMVGVCKGNKLQDKLQREQAAKRISIGRHRHRREQHAHGEVLLHLLLFFFR